MYIIDAWMVVRSDAPRTLLPASACSQSICKSENKADLGRFNILEHSSSDRLVTLNR